MVWGIWTICSRKSLATRSSQLARSLMQLGLSMKNELYRSKGAGMMNPVTLFIPWSIYRHILVIVRGYGGHVQCNSYGSKYYVTIAQMDTAMKTFSTVRFAGECVLAYQHSKRVPTETLGKKMVSVQRQKCCRWHKYTTLS